MAYATLPVSSLPQTLQDFFKKKGFKKKTVIVTKADEPLTELRPLREFDSRYDDFDNGDRKWAVALDKPNLAVSQPGAGNPPAQLPAGDWARVSIYGYAYGTRGTKGAAVDFHESAKKYFPSSESLTLPPQAAQLLYCLTKSRAGEYRNKCAADVPGGMRGPFLDWLLENGLVKRNAAGAAIVTPRGDEVASKIPDVYHPSYYHPGRSHVPEWNKPYVNDDGTLKPYTSGGSLLGLGSASQWMRVPGRR